MVNAKKGTDKGKIAKIRAVVLTADDFENMELFFPVFRLMEEGIVVVDGNLVTSRYPLDLPDFMRETIKLIRK